MLEKYLRQQDLKYMIAAFVFGYFSITSYNYFVSRESHGWFLGFLILFLILLGYIDQLNVFRKCIYFHWGQLKYLLPPLIEISIFCIALDIYLIATNQMRPVVEAGAPDFLLSEVLLCTREELVTTFLWTVGLLLCIRNLKRFKKFEKKHLIGIILILSFIFTALHFKTVFIRYDEYLKLSSELGKVKIILYSDFILPVAFCKGFYMKTVFLKTHNLVLTILIHTITNISIVFSMLIRVVSMDHYILSNVITILIYLLLGILALRGNWNLNFWNSEFARPSLD